MTTPAEAIRWEGRSGSANASDLGFGGDFWPYSLRLPVPGHTASVSFTRAGMSFDAEHEARHATYQSAAGYTVTVFNE